jgi:hypothetical protein
VHRGVQHWTTSQAHHPLPYFVEIKLTNLNKKKHLRRLKLMKYTNI